MTILGVPTNYKHKYRFVVEIDDFARAYFTKMGELSAEIGKIEIWEGGALTANKEAGRVEFADVTLERGASNDEDCYIWFKDVVEAYRDAGTVPRFYKRNIDLVEMDRAGNEVNRWTVEEAWPSKFVAGEWDNEADEVVMESLTLTYRLFKKPSD